MIKAVFLYMMLYSAADMRYGIIGAGQVGTALAVSLGASVAWVVNRGELRRLHLGERLRSVAVYASIEDIPDPPDCVLLAVSDAAVELCAQWCAQHWGAKLKDRFVVHCSGSLSRSVLSACANKGARTVAAHPFQTIVPSLAAIPSGVAWGVEAEDPDQEFARAFVEYFGGVAFFLSDDTRAHRALYHAAASAAANYLTVLASCAADLATAAGIPASLFLPPIMHTALDNALSAVRNEQPLPLTGPIARADVGTLARHIEQLRVYPALLREYCLFGAAAAEHAARQGVLSSVQRDTILSMFYTELGDTHATLP